MSTLLLFLLPLPFRFQLTGHLPQGAFPDPAPPRLRQAGRPLGFQATIFYSEDTQLHSADGCVWANVPGVGDPAVEQAHPGAASGPSRLLLLQPERACAPHLPNSGVKLGEGVRPGAGRVEILGWHRGAETCSEPLPSLQGLPTEEDFSEVLTQVHKVGGADCAGRGDTI